MTQVKLCGIRNASIAEQLHAADLKPAYAGFVFAKSRRQIPCVQAAVLSQALGNKIQKVGVFVNPGYDELLESIEACQLDVVQLHGQESPEFCSQVARARQDAFVSTALSQIKIWKAFSVNRKADAKTADDYQGYIQGVLLDTYDPNAAGGTGKTFDWALIDSYRELFPSLPLIIAGGIHEQNVEELIRTYCPDVIDVSSGIEAEDGTQDFQKMISLLKRVNSI